jgi:hypothetical protein
MPRFVLLEHDHPSLHWDLMLEAGEVLWAWRLPAPPAPGAELVAERTFDHRRLYLDYEGPVSGGRGAVARWDHGTFEWVEKGEGALTVNLSGARVRGVLRLEQGEGPTWRVALAAAQP